MCPFQKKTFFFQELHYTSFVKDDSLPYLLFIHGGPGLNSQVLEILVEEQGFFSNLNFNLFFYDQRGCGRSQTQNLNISHQGNIDDLKILISFLSEKKNIKIAGLMGHSYGAKLLFDFYCQTQSVIPALFIATASSILVPRLNNLLLDLNYLKMSDRDAYQEIFENTSVIDIDSLCHLTQELDDLIQKNDIKKYMYWANLRCLELVEALKERVAPINMAVFKKIREEIYSSENHYSIEIESLKIPYLWINGFYDGSMGVPLQSFLKRNNVTIFYKSSHYPHIEENEKFTNTVNEFLSSY